MNKFTSVFVYILGWSRRLEDFSYKDKEMLNLINDVLNETEFEGVSVIYMTSLL